MRALIITLAIVALIVTLVLVSREETAPVTTSATTIVPATVQAPVISFTPTPIVESARTQDLFFARDDSALTAYDTLTARPRFSLPLGMMSADRRLYATAAVKGETTTIREFDLQTGAVTREMVINGEWELGAVSATGRWLALQALVGDRAESTIEIADMSEAKTKSPFVLDGNFYVDAISSEGASLFLIENLPAVNPDHYQVRLYHVNAGQLEEGALVDKRAPDEVMAGDRLDAVASPDGTWLFSLYIRPRDNVAFIHALNLQDKYAICIDLPEASGNAEALKQYSLALAPDNRSLYAANAALGIAAEISLDAWEVEHNISFAPDAGSSADFSANAAPSRSVVSPNGNAVYFASRDTIWTLDTRAWQVNNSIALNQTIVGLGLDQTDTRLYVVTSGNQLARVFDILANGVLKPIN